FEAVNAITADDDPYLGTVTTPPGASAEAAAAAAAHGVLTNYFPASAASLDAALVTSLAAIPDGPAKDDGVAVGEAAAGAMLADRTNAASAPPPPPPAAGPRAGAVDAGMHGRCLTALAGPDAVRRAPDRPVPTRSAARAHERAVHEGLRRGEDGRRGRQHGPPARSDGRRAILRRR